MRQQPDTYAVTEIACMDYRDNRTFVDKSEYDRLAAKIERLAKERDATIAQQAAEIERERAARKTAQESLENYKGECTRLQHEVDRLKGEARLINRREHEATELRPAL